MRGTWAPSESRQWKQARRAAFVQEILAVFTQRPASLLSFEQVQRKLQLDEVHYLDLQDVPLEQIVGSVGRYQDFTRAFFPREDHLQDRWQQIERLITTGRSLPPVELYKVGQVYFVRDGNHRVSVAQKQRMPTIRAYVWEFQTDIPLEPGSDFDELLCRTAHAAFLERTQLDRLCPDLDLKLTQPDGYVDLLYEIEAFQQIISEIDGREVSFDEAVTLWHQIRYVPIAEIIRERFVLQEFPGRTEADLYLWLCRNREELEARYEPHVLLQEAADDLTRRFGERIFPTYQLKKVIARVVGATVGWTTGRWEALRRAFGRRRMT